MMILCLNHQWVNIARTNYMSDKALFTKWFLYFSKPIIILWSHPINVSNGLKTIVSLEWNSQTESFQSCKKFIRLIIALIYCSFCVIIGNILICLFNRILDSQSIMFALQFEWKSFNIRNVCASADPLCDIKITQITNINIIGGSMALLLKMRVWLAIAAENRS